MSKTAFLKQKNAFHFIAKALLLLEIFKFKNFRILSFKTSSNAYAWNKKCILLNNLGGKHSLLMTFVKFMWYYKKKKKNFHQGILQKCWISNDSQAHIYIWTRNLTVIDLISFIDLICNFSTPQTLSFVKE